MGTRQIHVSGELWQQICTVGWRGTFECIEGLPEGATFLYVSYKHHSIIQGKALFCRAQHPNPKSPNIVIFVFEHPDWPEVELGEDAPILRVTMKQTHDDTEL